MIKQNQNVKFVMEASTRQQKKRCAKLARPENFKSSRHPLNTSANFALLAKVSILPLFLQAHYNANPVIPANINMKMLLHLWTVPSVILEDRLKELTTIVKIVLLESISMSPQLQVLCVPFAQQDGSLLHLVCHVRAALSASIKSRMLVLQLYVKRGK